MSAERDERVEEALRSFRAEACRREMLITGDGRVSETDAALLLGYEPETLAKKRDLDGPEYYRRGVGGCRVSYRLIDLAVWVEAGRK